MVTLLPDTTHTAGEVEVNVTASPEVALALRANGAELKVRFAGAEKLMLWLAFAMVKVRVTFGAAFHDASPACEART